MNPTGQQLIIVLLVVLLLFGAKRLPDLARSLGTSIKEFRIATREAMNEDTEQPADSDPSPDADPER